jgi:hypothetical protein
MKGVKQIMYLELALFFDPDYHRTDHDQIIRKTRQFFLDIDKNEEKI